MLSAKTRLKKSWHGLFECPKLLLEFLNVNGGWVLGWQVEV